MATGFYDQLAELQSKNNTFYTGALLAFELTERNTSFSMALVRKYFGSIDQPIFVKRLMEFPLPNGAEEPLDYQPKILTEVPGMEFPNLPTVDKYLSCYANHPLTKDKVLYTWLDNKGEESDWRTFSQLDTRASMIADHLLISGQPVLKPGDCVVLLHPPGLEFIDTFLGCLRARILAVPLIPPDPVKRGGDQALEKLVNVVKITNARAILSTRAYHSAVRASSMSFLKRARLQWPQLPWIHTNCLYKQKSANSFAPFATKWIKEFTMTSLGLNNMISARQRTSTTDLAQDGGEAVYQAGLEKVPDNNETPKFNKSMEKSDVVDTNALQVAPGLLNEVCFLQFTSGSTGDAKGVMITQGALIHNVKSMRAAYKSTTRSVVVSWLPQYHDMGLIGGLLVSLVTGGSLILLSPITFIHKPLLWLHSVEKYQATHTASPNFGFELVLRRYEMLKATKSQIPNFDLSSLVFLMVGAEPISSQAMRAFVETFWDAGVREQIFAPCFGMAENCVFICCAFGRNTPMLVDFDGRVCCGYIDASQKKGVYSGCNPHSQNLCKMQPQEADFLDSCSDIRIVNPKTLEEVGNGVEGEIWLSSPSNGVGYWGMAEATQQTFGVHLHCTFKNATKDCENDAKLMFVRSGDLGRVIDGNLFVTGRIKDLIIVQGRNFYPHDIEKAVERCSTLLRRGCSAAFSAPMKTLRSKGIIVDSSSEEMGIVVVAEVQDDGKMNKAIVDLISSNIKTVIAEEYGVQVSFVNLIKPRTIPKTTSGKIRRHECLKRFSDGTLSTIKGAESLHLAIKRAQSRLHQARPTFTTEMPSTPTVTSKEEITNFLVQVIVKITGLPASQINVTDSFENYSIDSQGTVAAASTLSEFLGTHISAIQIYTTGCISELAEFCDKLLKKISSRGIPGRQNSSPGHNSASFTPTSNISSMHSDSCQSDSPPCSEQSPVICTMRHEDVNIEEISEAQLSNALEPSETSQAVITILQVIGILYMGALLSMPAVYIYKKLIHIIVPHDHIGTLRIILLSTTLVPLAWILYIATMALVLSILGAKVFLPMNSKSQTAPIPLWSFSYVRWWTLYRLQDFASSALAGHLRGTIFLTYWYRLLGAQIEEGVYLDTVDITDPSLLSIGSGAVVGEGATIQCHEVNAGLVTFQSVSIGRQCTVGPYAVIQKGTRMGPGSRLSALSKTEVGEHLSVESHAHHQLTSHVKHKPTSLIVILGQLFGVYLVGLLSTISAVVEYATLQWLGSSELVKTAIGITSTKATTESASFGYLLFPLMATFPRYLVLLAPVMTFVETSCLLELLMHITKERKLVLLLVIFGLAYIIYGVTLGALTSALKWCIIGRRHASSIPNNDHHQGLRFRLWLVQALLRSAHDKFVVLLMGTEAVCIYLRSLGSKVGHMASLRRLNAVADPDLLNLGDECHVGDFSKIITSEYIPGNMMSSGVVQVSKGCVLGAQSMLMPGSTMHNQAMLGAMSVAPTGAILEERGVYVGVKTPVKIYQRPSNTKGLGEASTSLQKEVKDQKTNGFKDEKEHPLLVGVENLEPRFRQIIASVAAEFVKNTPKGHSRYLHHTGAGGKGTLRIFDNIHAKLPPHDVLTPGATFPVILRCSNGVSEDDDRCIEVRGCTLRILRQDSPDDFKKPLLDLLMKTGDIFHARNMVEFLGYYLMTEEEREEKNKDFPALGESQWGNLRKPNSYAELHYFTCTTRLFQSLPTRTMESNLDKREGKEISKLDHNVEERFYVRFKIRPMDEKFGEDEGKVEPTTGLPLWSGMYSASTSDTRSKSFLRDDFKSKLESPAGVKCVLQLQLHPIPTSDKEREEVQDPTKVWDCKAFPHIDVGELWLNEHIEDKVFDDIHFNPKHGPQSLAIIPATSSMQVASIDTCRSIMHDILGYLRSGTPLPSLWSNLVEKSHLDLVESDPYNEPIGCPMVSSNNKASKLMKLRSFEHDKHNFKNGEDQLRPSMVHDHETSNFSKKSSSLVHERFLSRAINQYWKVVGYLLHSWNLALLRILQPILQVIAPIALLGLALYPPLLILAIVGTSLGKQWMYMLLPLAFLCTGLILAALCIVCKWIVSWTIQNGHANELWSLATLCHTVWDVVNQTLASTFLELVRGSALCTWYLQALGASIKSISVYIDTLHVLNPDQVRIGERIAIGRNVLLFGHLYEGEKVVYKSNVIGDDTFIGTRALVLPGLKMENGAQLPTLGLGMKDEVICADYSN